MAILKMNIDANGLIKEIGYSDYTHVCPAFINFDNTNIKCINILDINNPASWQPLPVNPTVLKQRDIDYGNSLLLEFLTGQKDLSLDNPTYRAISNTFQYAELALRRGDLVQAKTELSNIPPTPPVFTQATKDYFINKINQYLGI